MILWRGRLAHQRSGVTLSTIVIGTIVAFLIDVGDTGRSVEIGTYVSLAGVVIAFIAGLAALLCSGSDSCDG
jgi:hypothetical protein